MAKDTSGIKHADYVVGPRNLGINMVRHLAALSQPTAQPTRADRRANMAQFRDERFRAARIAAANAAFKAKPEPAPAPARFLAAPLPSRAEAVASTVVAKRCQTRKARA